MQYQVTPTLQACPAGLVSQDSVQVGQTATVDMTPERADLAIRCCAGLKVVLLDKKSEADEASD